MTDHTEAWLAYAGYIQSLNQGDTSKLALETARQVLRLLQMTNTVPTRIAPDMEQGVIIYLDDKTSVNISYAGYFTIEERL